jgi:formylglycine-generating enzyme required for sulfatase activity
MNHSMKLRLLTILLLPLAAAHADTFGSGANTFTMDFATIGNAGNADDDTGYGSVGYTYRMGVNEVSRGMIDAYNALSGGPTLTMSDMTSYGGNGAAKPATGISWNEAARFVNWLNTSKGYSAAYKFTTGGFNDDIALWTINDAGYDAANPFRNANAHYYLPSEDEWYKAAYYDPNKSGGAGYWNYATGSDTAPTAVASGTTSGTAVYGQSVSAGPADITNAGGASPYGTMAQSGNVYELGESGIAAPNDSASESRLIRGGIWFGGSGNIDSLFRNGNSTTQESFVVGFRVAAVPEPSACFLTLLGALGVVFRRRR